MSDSIRIDCWDPARSPGDIEMLAEVLHACVHAGGSVSFILPFALAEALAFWRDQVLPGVAAGSRRVLLARLGGRVAGTVQLDMATPPNQPHRAEVKKLLVHPEARRRGIARSLMWAAEIQARAGKRSLLTLDTVTGGAAHSLYASLGFVAAGEIPGYALNYDSSRLEPTMVMYKRLATAI